MMYAYILVMALTTYLIRVVPLVLLKKPIRSVFLRSFLHYVPVACLTAMTFPAILFAADHLLSGLLGLAVCVLLAFKDKSLMVVALAGCGTVFVVEQLMQFI